MAQSGGYDLSDPFIDDGNLTSQATSITVYSILNSYFRFLNPHLSVFSLTIHLKLSRALLPKKSLLPIQPNAVLFFKPSFTIEKGEHFQLTDKQRQQLSSWKPSPTVQALLDTLKVYVDLLIHSRKK